MNTSVFCVEQGEYSDYKIVGVFSTPEKAQQLIDKMKVDYAAENEGEEMYGSSVPRIVERKIDPYVEELNQGLLVFEVIMARNGDTMRCANESFATAYDFPNVYGPCKIRRLINIEDRAIHGYVFAKDEKHAIKIMNEKRVALIAEGLL